MVSLTEQPLTLMIHVRVLPTSRAMPHTFYRWYGINNKKGGGGGEQCQNWRENYREWRCPGLSPSHENPPNKRPRTGRCQDLEDNFGGSRQGHRGVEVLASGEPPIGLQVPGRRTRMVKGGRKVTGMMADTGMRRGAQRRAAEAGGGWPRLEGGGWGRSPSWRRFVPGEDVGSGCK